ncbi:MAG: hypothetical protein J6U00_00820 [Ruminococcus sp.]|uniref:hypothetical protein n=1 Tax=Ruminococcus sp. TaxID=41978 RepID=UPI001B021188|nr:hypothetical protein [Ruminococcus sp.]MBO7472541.1 hypothetical protein [Ruminococcus sp.]
MSVFTKTCIFITGFLLLPLLAAEIVALTTNLIFAPALGMRVTNISFFGLEFNVSDNKWTVSLRRFSPIIQHDVRFDSRKSVESFSDRKADMLQFLSVAAKFAVAAALCFSLRGLLTKPEHFTHTELLLFSFAAGMVFHAFFSLAMYIYTSLVLVKRLGGCINSIIKRLRQGESYASIDMKPMEELGLKKSTKNEQLLYYQLYMGHLAAMGNYNGMREPSHKAMNILMDRGYFVQETGSYYWLIYFFSEVEPNPQITDLLLERLGSVINKDNDANAKRVLAYYLFNIKRDFDGAQEMVNEGFRALDSDAGLATERDLERLLLTDLNERLQVINKPAAMTC